jgi:hypothetical protein
MMPTVIVDLCSMPGASVSLPVAIRSEDEFANCSNSVPMAMAKVPQVRSDIVPRVLRARPSPQAAARPPTTARAVNTIMRIMGVTAMPVTTVLRAAGSVPDGPNAARRRVDAASVPSAVRERRAAR